MSDADRNALFGTLAVRLRYIDELQYEHAMLALAAGPQRSLGEILVECGQLDAPRVRLLELLLQDQLETRPDDALRSPSELATAAWANASVQSPGDTDATEAIPGMAPASLRAIPTPGDGQRYTVLRPHARGGLGQVFLANDRELNRQVALKEMQARFADHAGHRSRFLFEAEITGRLEHPGIVPVYGLGAHPDGRPYYAMRFIRGETLHAAIAAYHAKRFADEGERNLAFRGLLSRFVGACNTIAYAHSRGILHRDIKPSNIMLGNFGEALVVDWGLAKPIGKVAPDDSTLEHEPPFPSAGDELAPTEQGSIKGTPAFMSPEQALGEIGELGIASDVYSLGATLYMLATGRAPFGGTGREQLERVVVGDYVSPRIVQPSLAPALDAIVCKAMAKRPEDRYPSASALAKEIEQYLADEPVAAYREPVTDRLRRFARKHRTGVAGLTALVGALSLASFVGLYFVNAERQRTQLALAKAEAAHLQAVAARNRTRDALDEMTSDETSDRILQQRELGPSQKQFLEKVIAYYQEFAGDDAADEEARRRTAEAACRVSHLQQKLGRSEAAIVSHRRGIALLASLAADYPAKESYRSQLAGMRGNLGTLFEQLGRAPEAEVEHRASLAIRAKLVAANGADPELHFDLAQGRENLATLLNEAGRRDEAEGLFRQAIAATEELVAAQPRQPRYKSDLARYYGNLANLLVLQERLEPADAAFRRAIELQRQLRDAYPDAAVAVDALCMTLNNYANFLSTRGQREPAFAMLREAIAAQAKLVETYPAVPAYASSLGSYHYNLANYLEAAGDRRESLEEYRRAEVIVAPLVERSPEVPRYRSMLAHCHNNIGLHHAALGEPAAAEKRYAQALAEHGELADQFPDKWEYRVSVAGCHCNLAKLHEGQPADSLRDAERAVAILEPLNATKPGEEKPRQFLRNSLAIRAAALEKLERFAEAAGDFERAAGLSVSTEAKLFQDAVRRCRDRAK